MRSMQRTSRTWAASRCGVVGVGVNLGEGKNGGGGISKG